MLYMKLNLPTWEVVKKTFSFQTDSLASAASELMLYKTAGIVDSLVRYRKVVLASTIALAISPFVNADLREKCIVYGGAALLTGISGLCHYAEQFSKTLFWESDFSRFLS